MEGHKQSQGAGEQALGSWGCLGWWRDSFEGLDKSHLLPMEKLSRRKGEAFDSGPRWEDEKTSVETEVFILIVKKIFHYQDNYTVKQAA